MSNFGWFDFVNRIRTDFQFFAHPCYI